MSVTLTISGDDPMQVAAMVRLLGIREVTVTPYDHEVSVRQASPTEPEPTAPDEMPDRDGDEHQPLAVPKSPKPPAATTPKPTGPSDADLELLAALTGDLRPAVDIAVQIGIKRTSCGGVARKLDRLADAGRCERGELPDGKRGYRAMGVAVVEPDPPAPPVDLPARAPYLHLGDLTGHALRVAWELRDHGPLTRHELAERLELPEGETRETVRMLIRQGYVTRLDGNVVRYALTDAVVRDEAARAAG